MKFDCVELVGNVCTRWELVSADTGFLQALAITKEQANDIIISILVLWFGAWGLKQVLNLIQRRRY